MVLKKYGGLIVLLLVFASYFIPKIYKMVAKETVAVNNRSATVAPLAYILINGTPRKAPEFALTNQDSLYITNEDYHNKVYVIDFFFTRCPSVCPTMSRNLKTITDSIGARNDFGIASFTINPEHDTPQVLKNYAELYEIDLANWHLLTGDKEKILSLASERLNIYAAKNDNAPGGFEHQDYFALIDKKGYLRSRLNKHQQPKIYYSGTDNATDDSDIQQLIEDIKLLLNE